jgi:large subunit ribosomal protein L16
MGKGKAEVEQWVSCVKPGMMMFEIGGVSEDVAKRALTRVAHKMPVKCRLVIRKHAIG